MSKLQEVNRNLQLDGDGGSLDVIGLERALAAMDEVSNEITAEVSASGILSGIDSNSVASQLDDWRVTGSAPRKLPSLRPHCAETLEAAIGLGCRLDVLSLNWCPPLIHAYLPMLASSGGRVFSNTIDRNGMIDNVVNGAAAKREIIRTLVDEARRKESESSVMYIGDSSTDLLALLEADVGILIGESASARRMACYFGVRIEPLPEQGFENPDGVLWEANSWMDVRRCIIASLG